MDHVEFSELPWAGWASCRDADPDLFFPPPGGDEVTPLAICSDCRVRVQCLSYALEFPERDGIWGGTTQRHRRRILRERREGRRAG